MTDQTIMSSQRQTWVAPEVRELDIRETALSPGPGNDVGGNPSPDCQKS